MAISDTERGIVASMWLLTIQQAAIEIGLNPEAGYLRQLARLGKIPVFKLPEGRDLLIWRKDFKKWASKRDYDLKEIA